MADMNLRPGYGSTLVCADMVSFYAGYRDALGSGMGNYFALSQYLSNGLDSYIDSVISGIDPTGGYELADDVLSDLLGHDVAAEALGCLGYWPSIYECQLNGLRSGAEMTQAAFLDANAPDVVVEVSSDKESYATDEQIVLLADVTTSDGGPVESASVSYTVEDAFSSVVSNGLCEEAEPGRYRAVFNAGELGAVGVFTITALAEDGPYVKGDASTSVTVEHAPQIGHDVGVTGVAWAASSSIQPHEGNLHAMPGESIVANAFMARNFGDYSENTIPVYMTLSGPGARQSNTRYVSRGAGEESMCYESLSIDTTDMPEGAYELTIASYLPGDSDENNDGESWQIVLGNPGPQPGQLPYESYDLYRCQHTSGSATTPVGDFAGYSLRATYVSNEMVNLYDGATFLGSLHQDDAPTAFDNGRLIAYLDGAASFSGTYFIDLMVGVESTFVQDNPMQVVYARPGPTNWGYDEIDPRYCARYDYYLPSFGATSDDVFMLGWGPRLTRPQVDSYKYQFTTTDKPDSFGGSYDNYGGAVYTTNGDGTGPGTIREYYVFVPSTNAPEGDYSFLIIQETDASVVNGWYRLGFGHSVRTTVEYYRDLAISSTTTSPAGALSGDVVEIGINVTNLGDVAHNGVPVEVNVHGPGGCAVSLAATLESIPWQSDALVQVDWDTAGLAAGNYTISARLDVPRDADTQDNSRSLSVDLLPPPSPPALQVALSLDQAVYDQNTSVNATARVTDDASDPVIGASVSWELIHHGSAVTYGSGVTSALGEVDVPVPPLAVVGEYELRVVGTCVGFDDGDDSEVFAVRDSTPPTVPIPVTPMDGQPINVSQPALDWLDSTDADSGVAGYQVECDGITFDVIESRFVPSEALTEGAHRFRIRSKDSSAQANLSAWSDEQSFVVDLTAPRIIPSAEGLQLVDTYPTDHNASALAILDGRLYLAISEDLPGHTPDWENYGALQVLDISQPESPVGLGELLLRDEIDDIVVRGQTTYVAAGNWGLQILDTSDPNDPVVIGNFDEWAGSYSMAFLGIAVDEPYVYAADHWKGLVVIDATDQTAPQHVMTKPFGYYEHDVEVDGQRAYLLHGSGSHGSDLEIVDISDPAAPSVLNSVHLPASSPRFTFAGGFAYVVARDAHLYVVDISDPATASVVGSVETEANGQQVIVLSNKAYVAVGEEGVQVFDLSDPTAPDPLWLCDTQGFAMDLAVTGAHVYVADREGGIAILEHGVGTEDPSNSLSMRFDENVSIWSGKAALTLRNDTTGTDVDLAEAGFAYDPVANTASWDFSGFPHGSLPSGHYSGTLTATGITDLAGNELDGDADGAAGGDYEFAFEIPAEVVGRHVFYNHSAWDGNDAGVGTDDDAAIATDKQALLPDETATFTNYTSYSRGINGIMIDVDGLAGTPTASGFAFKTGNSNDPSTWTTAPAPLSITVRPGEGDGDSDRVTIIWADNAIQKQWLQVTVLSDADGGSLGLAEDDVFYFGNLPGDATGDGVTNSMDLLKVRQNYRGPASAHPAADYNKDGVINAIDLLAVRQNYRQGIDMISTPAAPTGMAMMTSTSDAQTEPLLVEPVTAQTAPAVEQVQVVVVPTSTVPTAAISAVFSQPVSVAPAALEIFNPVGRKIELPAFQYEPVTRKATWSAAGLTDGLYQGVIRSSDGLSDGVSMARDSQFRFRLTSGIISEFQQDTNGDGIIDLLDLVVL